jgi:uncharacterized C2H2 Zn-finger protein
MARARKKTTTKSRAKRVSKTATRAASTAFKCPECGKTFARAAALGAHRRRAHGVVGASGLAKSASKRRAVATRATTATAARPGRRRRGISVNRDQLLQTLFPAGVPAREEVIRSVNSWLDEAERLAALQ